MRFPISQDIKFKSRLIFNLETILLLIICFGTSLSNYANARTFEVSEEVENAVITENWVKLADLLTDIKPETPSPILRLIKAHACLATNSNNESVQLFYGVTFGDLEEWEKWCKNTATVTGNQALKNYFLGDIHARLLNYKKAIEYLSLAIDQNSDSYLALNARGTVYIIQEEYERALSDLIKAKAINPKFADVYNNLAMINIRQRKGLIDNSMNSFMVVHEINPDFALAFHGLGCLELLISKTIAVPEDNINIRRAIELIPGLTNILVENETKYLSDALDKQSKILFADAGTEGTAIQRVYKQNEYKLTEQTNKLNTMLDLRNNFQSSSGSQGDRLGTGRILDTRIKSLQNDIVKSAAQMSSGEVNRLTLSNPVTAGRVLSAVSTAEKGAARYVDLHKTVDRDILTNPKTYSTIASAIPAIGGPASRIIDAKIDNYRNNLTQRHSNLQALKSNFVKGQNHYINEHITKGSFDGRKYTMNNPLSPTGKSTYTPSQSPDGYAGQLNITPGYAGNRSSINNFKPGGATTEKALITWNDGEWPFNPIFGLLYQIPQTQSESDNLNTEVEK